MHSRLRDLADVHYGKSPNNVLSDESTVPVIGTGGIYGRASRSLFSGPAVVVARKGTLGNPQFIDEPFWPVDTTYAVVAKTGVDTKWLYYSLAAFDLTKLNEATGVPSISRDWLYRVPLGSTDFSAQRRIAEILSTLDEAIEQTEALIAKHQQIKAGLMHDLFTCGVTPDGHLRPTRAQAPDLYKPSPLGWIPKEWDAGTLQDLVSPTRLIVYGILMPGTGFPGGVPVVKVKDIFGGEIRTDNLLLTSPEIDAAYQRSKLKAGDVLLTIRGTVGRLASVPSYLDGANITQDTARIGVVRGNADFYRHFLETAVPRAHFAVNTLGVAVQGINLRDVRTTPVPLVAEGEQQLIVDALNGAVNFLRTNNAQLEQLRQQKHGLMHDLLTGKVRINATLSAQEGVA